MKRSLLTGNVAAAWGARLALADYIPAFPITPQTEIIETIAAWIDRGEMDARMTSMDSEHSMITAAAAAATTGVRTFSATSSQGLLYGMEMLYAVSGWRAPFVLMNVSRGLASPVTLEPDHNDIMAARDCGFLQIHCSSCQEVLDSTLMAFRLGEDQRIRLPVIVNLDGFYLSFTREPVAIPDAEEVRRFVGDYDPQNIRFRAGSPISQAVAVLGGAPYSYFRYETHLAAENGIAVYEEISAEFAEAFGRHHPAIESYHCDDADIVLVMLGSFATKAKVAVDEMRRAGQRVGLLRPRLFRPFPTEGFRSLLAGKFGVAVIDQNISMGMGGVLHSELASALYGQPGAPPQLLSFIGGLGGRDISQQEFFEIVRVTHKAVAEKRTPPPRLLYTEEELREVRKLQAVARVEQG
ncbi:pyruvate synthase [Desulfotalea psychrophila]|uniref:Related to pyruvate synthase, subunit PorA n=1 Tax=Desulfotalea psychrophila (strain LSv54 / DSM 12343) TaxID=177439 RepID=Q6ANZ5_DESPS|nr:pyruvate synthase [Desulfotalea psychrophila]CAG35929.1 related to pyruvate synthase, subunit PorA [Desulfotalea psychrophila LSv54]